MGCEESEVSQKVFLRQPSLLKDRLKRASFEVSAMKGTVIRSAVSAEVFQDVMAAARVMNKKPCSL